MKPLRKFKLINAETIENASALLAKHNGKAWPFAGGTDIIGTLREAVLPNALYPDVLVNLHSIKPSLEYVKEENGTLKIGALTRLEDIAKNATVKSKYKALAEAAGRAASPHIREMGTIGGNICQLNRCWYFRKEDNRFNCHRKGGAMCYAMAGDNRYHSIFGASQGCVAVNPGDIAPALVALNAKIVTNKRILSAEEFWTVEFPGSTVLKTDEIVTEIQVPTPPSGTKSAFVKLALRKSIDFPIINCAALIGGETARICLNAVAPTPYRPKAAEEEIKGKSINETTAEAAASKAVAGAIPLTHNKWKIAAAKGVVKKTILACA